MSTKTALQEWAKETRALIPDDVRRLIGMANWDLYNGPSGGGLEDEDEQGETIYPGFETACKRIREALDDTLPSVLYVDDQDCYSTEEPKAEECHECTDGVTPEGEKCWACGASGYIDPEPYTELDRHELMRAIVGKELVQYL